MRYYFLITLGYGDSLMSRSGPVAYLPGESSLGLMRRVQEESADVWRETFELAPDAQPAVYYWLLDENRTPEAGSSDMRVEAEVQSKPALRIVRSNDE